jgi:hypothetical protein
MKIDEFNASRSQTLVHKTQVLRQDSTLLSAHSAALEEAGLERKSATQVSGLHCGHTTTIVEGFDWAMGVRWTALRTRIRAVHVFAVSPYGAPPDVKSHAEARVRNVELLVCSFSWSF